VLRGLLEKDVLNYRLLTPNDVGEDFFRQQYVKFQPWSVGDTNRDGEQDVVAVLVKGSTPPLYNVIVIHGGSTRDIAWLWRDVTMRILSVKAETGEVWPLTCTECDANRPLRWTGREYDWDVLLPGESVCLSAGTMLLDEPNDSAIPVISLANPMELRIVEIGKRDPGRTVGSKSSHLTGDFLRVGCGHLRIGKAAYANSATGRLTPLVVFVFDHRLQKVRSELV